MHTAKIDLSKLTLRPVPAGHTMRYLHHYKTPKHGPMKLLGTTAWLENAEGEMVGRAESWVRKGDTPIKKLGRIIAHNRCVKAFVS